MAVSVTNGNKGIGNATVALIDAEENVYTGTTGSAGGCNIRKVPVGTYTVIVNATGYFEYVSSEDVEISEESHALTITMTEREPPVEIVGG